VSPAADRPEEIRKRLVAALNPVEIEVTDESHLHRGHAGARDGRGHFRVRIIAEQFAGLPQLARHRIIYAALADLMQTDIHALAITASAPADKARG